MQEIIKHNTISLLRPVQFQNTTQCNCLGRRLCSYYAFMRNSSSIGLRTDPQSGPPQTPGHVLIYSSQKPEKTERSYLSVDMPRILSGFLEVANDAFDTRADNARVVGSFTTQRDQSLRHPTRRGTSIWECLNQRPQPENCSMSHNDKTLLLRCWSIRSS